jgi:hypothetical protein
MSLEQTVGIGLIVLAGILIVVFAIVGRKKKLTLRNVAAMQRLRQSVGLSIEDGKRLHVSLGNASILGTGNTAALAGLSALERMAIVSMVSDRPPVVTTGDGSLMLLGQDTLRYVYRKGNVLAQYDPLRSRMSGATPFSYAVGALPVLRQEDVLTSVLIGRFGPEVTFLNDLANQKSIYSVAASDDLTAQAVMFATAQDPLIGEELFAIPAYLRAGPFHQASLLTQDILRWILVAIMLGGVLLVILKQLFGITIL